MKLVTVAALVAIAGAAISFSGTANAAVGINFDFGNVDVGYSDGYYDHSHHWHRWAHRADMNRWQHDHGNQYHGWRHDDHHHH